MQNCSMPEIIGDTALVPHHITSLSRSERFSDKKKHIQVCEWKSCELQSTGRSPAENATAFYNSPRQRNSTF